MIVCSCNTLSDRDVRACLANACRPPRNAAEAYRCCGKPAVCGRCAPTLLGIMRDIDAAPRKQPDQVEQAERQPAAA